jgi:N-acetylglucosamine-6-phosphate deacetylase
MTWLTGLDLLDIDGLHPDQSIRIADGRVAEIATTVPKTTPTGAHDLRQDGVRALICPGPIDLQVNGGGGLMLTDCRTQTDLSRLAGAHRAGGTVGLLPTLISDTPATTARIVDLVAQSTDPMILGLHLEGPHLTVAGAHDPALLRPMCDADIDGYVAAKARLGTLLITLAPEMASTDQIAQLTAAGIVVSLGHSACDYDTARVAFAAGAVMATHLFNAMSGLHHRAPGLVGAALDHAACFGLIADGQHVHPAALRLALRARPDAAFLVTDAMAVAGSDATGFTLGTRHIQRADGRLSLPDGTLAGADITMLDAARTMAAATRQSLTDTLPLAFAHPWRIAMGRPARFAPGLPARLIALRHDQLIGHIGADGLQSASS